MARPFPALGAQRAGRSTTRVHWRSKRAGPRVDRTTAIMRVASCALILWLAAVADARAQVAQVQPAQVADGSSAETAPREVQSSEADSASSAEAVDASAELWQVDRDIWELRHEVGRERILAPLVLLVAGYGTALVGMAAAGATFVLAEDVQHWDVGDRWRDRLDVNDDGSIDSDDEQAFRRMARSFAVIGGVGTVIGIVGTVLLANRLREQRAYAPEMRSLKQRRRELRRQLEYGGNLSPATVTLSLRGRF
jgi:hypothetical protein